MDSSEVMVVGIIGFVLVALVAICRKARFSGRVGRAGISVNIEPNTSSPGTSEEKHDEERSR